jgi:hypothetical protein
VPTPPPLTYPLLFSRPFFLSPTSPLAPGLPALMSLHLSALSSELHGRKIESGAAAEGELWEDTPGHRSGLPGGSPGAAAGAGCEGPEETARDILRKARAALLEVVYGLAHAHGLSFRLSVPFSRFLALFPSPPLPPPLSLSPSLLLSGFPSPTTSLVQTHSSFTRQARDLSLLSP